MPLSFPRSWVLHKRWGGPLVGVPSGQDALVPLGAWGLRRLQPSASRPGGPAPRAPRTRGSAPQFVPVLGIGKLSDIGLKPAPPASPLSQQMQAGDCRVGRRRYHQQRHSFRAENLPGTHGEPADRAIVVETGEQRLPLNGGPADRWPTSSW